MIQQSTIVGQAAANRTKLQLLMISVIGLALFHLLLGRHEFYPFIPWTMFSDVEHESVKPTVQRTMLIAVDAHQKTHEVVLERYFAAFVDSSDSSKVIVDRYIKRLRKDDPQAIAEIIRLIEAHEHYGPIVELRIEDNIWKVATDVAAISEILAFDSDSEHPIPEKTQIITSIPVGTTSDDSTE